MNNKKKKIIIASLLGMVVCLGIGFAAFSTTLKINGSAKVSPGGENYKVFFVSSVNSLTRYDRGDFDGEANSDKVDPGEGHFEDDTTFTNTGVTFSEDGQSVDYKFYILNAGKYDAHITNLDIGKKTCTPGEDADPALAASACSSINLSVILGDEGNQTTYTSSQAIEDHVLPKGTWEQIIVRITYPEGSPLVDGELDVKWEDISFLTITNPSAKIKENDSDSITEFNANDIITKDYLLLEMVEEREQIEGSKDEKITYIYNYYASSEDTIDECSDLLETDSIKEYKGNRFPNEISEEMYLVYLKKDIMYSFIFEDDEYIGFNLMANSINVPTELTPVLASLYGKSISNLSESFSDNDNIIDFSEFDIPSSVKCIDGIFYGDKNLIFAPSIPTTVKRVSWAFSGCTKLTDVTYEGTLEQYKSLEGFGQIGNNGLVVHCSDGDYIVGG